LSVLSNRRLVVNRSSTDIGRSTNGVHVNYPQPTLKFSHLPVDRYSACYVSMIRAFNPPQLWPPFGIFSHLALQGTGQIVHLKGQVALDSTGGIVGPSDMRVQLRQTLTNIRTGLASIGGEMTDILSLTHYTTDIEAFLAARDIRQTFLAEPYPATTTVQVARLYDPGLVIEIAGIAEIPAKRYRPPFVDRSAPA
jgi:2-iminobutanoate/2-iminopropanoate deaminase